MKVTAEQKRKEASKKGKKAKLDPSTNRTILEIQTEKVEIESKVKSSTPASIAEVREQLRVQIEELGKQRVDATGTGSNQRKRKKMQSMKDNEATGEQKQTQTKRPKSTQGSSHSRATAEDDLDEEDSADEDDLREDSDCVEEDEDSMQFARIISKQSRDKQKRKLNTKKLLEKAEQFQEHLGNVDDEEKRRILEKKSWKDALDKATGIKVKDDATLLSRSLKRAEKAKKKSQEAWKGRVEQVEADKRARQDKRRANIKAKKDERRDQRMGAKKKTGGAKGGKGGQGKKSPMRPGFEGKKSGFLNR